MEKKLDSNYTRRLWAILKKSWRQYPRKQQLYGHLPPISKTIQVRRSRHAGHRWRSKDELINDILLWTPSHGRAKVGRPARTYIQLLCADTGYSLEDLTGAMDDRDRWRERVREVCAGGTTWWWSITPYPLGLHLYRGVKTPNECFDITLNCIWWWGSSLGALWNVKYLFIAITLRSTFTRIGSTCQSPINGSNKTVLSYMVHSIGFQTFLYGHLKLS